MQEIIDRKSREELREWSRLPVMNEETKQFIRGKSDFFGLNYYTSSIVWPRLLRSNDETSFFNDQELLFDQDPAWPHAKSDWLYSSPSGFYNLLKFVYSLNFDILSRSPIIIIL